MHRFLKKPLYFKIRAFLFVLFVSVVINTHYYSDFQTTLLQGVYIQDGDTDLKANQWAVPVVYDWNDDGKKDLLIGSSYTDESGRSYGYVYFYENTGTDSAPSFSGHTLIQTCTDICSPVNAAAFG